MTDNLTHRLALASLLTTLIGLAVWVLGTLVALAFYEKDHQALPIAISILVYLPQPAAVILGVLAVRRIIAASNRIKGTGCAAAGIAIGVLGTALGGFALVMALYFFSVPIDQHPTTVW